VTLLKIYLYGYLNRVQSSRRLEREAQRNPADEQLGKPGNVGGSEETQMTITRREILHRDYPRLHPACSQAACQGVTS